MAAITAAGCLLRFYRLGDKDMWLDETFSVWMSRHTLPDLMAWLQRIDQHPPLYYTLLHFWLQAGDDAVQVRALSAIFSVLAIPVIFLLGRRLAGNTAGLMAAALLALSPFHVRFAQETRMYGLLTLNCSLAILMTVYLLSDPCAHTTTIGRQFGGFLQAWRTARQSSAGRLASSAPGQRRRLSISAVRTDLAWAGYMVFTAGTVLTHNTAIFFPIAVNIFVLGYIWWGHHTRLRRPISQGSGHPAWGAQLTVAVGSGHRPSPLAPRPPLQTSDLAQFIPPSLPNWIAAQIGVFLLWSPWLAAFWIQSLGVDRDFWIPAPTVATVTETIQNLLLAFLPGWNGWSNVVWLAAGALLVLGSWHLRRRPIILLFLVTLALTPVVGELLVSLRRPIFYDRTLIWATIPLYLVLSFGIIQLRSRPLIVAALVVIGTLDLVALQNYYDNMQKEQWGDAAAYVAQHMQVGDMILFNATWMQIPFDYYFHRYDKPAAEHGLPVDLFDGGVLEPKMTAADLPRMRDLVHSQKQLWLVYSHDWYTDPQKLIPAALAADFELKETQRFYGLEIQRYQAP